MSEIKTCEQYVLDKVQRLEDEIEIHKGTEAVLRACIAKFDELVVTLKRVISVSVASPHRLAIDCWSTYEKQDFDYLVKALELEVPEDKTAENKSEESEEK